MGEARFSGPNQPPSENEVAWRGTEGTPWKELAVPRAGSVSRPFVQ